MDSQLYLRGIELFNRGEFFEAHEVLEDVWRAAPPHEKQFLQGLTQIAVAFVHHSRQNQVGAASLLARGSRNLAGPETLHHTLDVKALLEAIEGWRRALEAQTQLPPLPRITILSPESKPRSE